MRYFTILSLSIATVASAGAAEQAFLANVSGTVYAATTNTIVQAPLNNARIFQEFGVSESDYALVLTPNSSDNFLALRPKPSSSVSNTIPVLQIGDAHSLISRKTKAFMYEVPITNSYPITNLFTGLRGNIFGTGKLSDVTDLTFSKLTFNVDGSAGDFQSLLVRFKVSTSKPFTVAP